MGWQQPGGGTAIYMQMGYGPEAPDPKKPQPGIHNITFENLHAISSLYPGVIQGNNLTTISSLHFKNISLKSQKGSWVCQFVEGTTAAATSPTLPQACGIMSFEQKAQLDVELDEMLLGRGPNDTAILVNKYV